MKKTIAFLLALLMLLTLAGAALASSVPMDKEDQMVGLVKSFLEENEFPYEYDDYTFTVPFAVENSMEYVYMTVYIYDDMLAVSADAPVLGTGDVFEKMAVFAALANNEIYYAQFRVELDADLPLLQSGGGCDPRRERAVLPVRHAAELYGGLRRRHPGGARRWRSLRGV